MAFSIVTSAAIDTFPLVHQHQKTEFVKINHLILLIAREVKSIIAASIPDTENQRITGVGGGEMISITRRVEAINGITGAGV